MITTSRRATLVATLTRILVALFQVWLVLALLREANGAFERGIERRGEEVACL